MQDYLLQVPSQTKILIIDQGMSCSPFDNLIGQLGNKQCKVFLGYIMSTKYDKIEKKHLNVLFTNGMSGSQ